MNSKRNKVRSYLLRALFAFALLVFSLPTVLSAQGLGLQEELGGLGGGGGSGEPMTLSASFKLIEGTQKGEISITAEIADGWYCYSLKQVRPPTASKIRLKKRDQLKSLGAFNPDHEPKIIEKDEVFGIRIEKHDTFVTWTAPFEFPEGVDAKKTNIDLIYTGQVCKVQCIEVEETLSVKFDGYLKAKSETVPATPAPKIKEVPLQASDSHAVFSGHIVAKSKSGRIVPGEKVQLNISAKGLDGFHVYAFHEEQVKDYTATLISFVKTSGLTLHAPTESIQPIVENIGGIDTWYYKEPVTFSYEIEIPKDFEEKKIKLEGLIGFQTCKVNCDPPDAVGFEVEFEVDGKEPWAAVRFSDKSDYGEVIKSLDEDYKPDADKPEEKKAFTPIKTEGDNLPWEPFTEELLSKFAFVTDESGNQTAFDFEQHERKSSTGSGLAKTFSFGTFFQALFWGFLGGLILNVMPCVLPVIGLKVMSFVQQGGDNKTKAFALNATYSAGIIAVFLVLATLGVFAGVTWGKQFQSQEFNIILACVVYVFALSLIGIWEIPIPGFVGTGKASELTEKEGMTGAFLKGVLTTVLATPCTGPFIIPVLTWAFQQHPFVVYAIFTAMGIGMASPFIIIGLNPKLVSFLPKPGNWMVTFKQMMGFVLLGTVIWIVRVVNFEYILPVFTLLFGLWLGCWWIGSMSFTATSRQKAIRWTTSIALAAVCGYIAFWWILPEARERFEMNYQPKIAEAQERPPGKYTMLIDFTAYW